MGADECCSTQLIDGDGEFNAAGLDSFMKTARVAQCGLSYAVVSIMGPQSSGKSTLLNHLFKTNFREMDAYRGRSQTTKGIWIAKCIGIEPCTIVMDLEGTDGRERGEDDTTFERQSALFALAISDIVLINMWCHDIGREHAANKPLLKTVFQVMMRLFSPRKTTLVFVIRDKSKTPLERLEPVLREDIQKIWDTVSKPQALKETPLSGFFNVEVTALPSYEEKEVQFEEQVSQLRQRFFHSIAPGGLAGDRRGVVPASGFSFSAQQIWKVIRENKDLDLPAHKVMVATVRCEEIANEKLSHLSFDERWLELSEAVQAGPVSGFGRKLSTILESYLSQYDMEAIYFEEDVRLLKKQQLETKALHLVHPAYQTMLGHLRSQALDRFKNELKYSLKRGQGFAVSVLSTTQFCLHQFDQGYRDVSIKQADWRSSKVREKLLRDMEAHAASVRSEKLSEITADYQNRLTDALGEPVESLFEAAENDAWASIRTLFNCEAGAAMSRFSDALSGFELEQEVMENMKKAREEAGKVLIRMKDRFSTVFSHDNDSMPRIWTGKEDIRQITRDARSALLSVMAVIRLDEKPDKVGSILYSNLLDGPLAQEHGAGPSVDPLMSSTWVEVSPRNVLISPVQCKSIWRQFKVETAYTVSQAISALEAHKRSNNWLPPLWAIVVMILLGFNEFMLLLRNPLYIVMLFVTFLVSKALWVQLDVPGEFRHGALSGLLALSSRFLPTVMNILRRLADDGQNQHQPGRQPPTESSAGSEIRPR
ncbi:unnamed protein product [Spirodela intermedia]|uniref:Protein ROOT HAIR DEFECTIVE 3 homolog n=1 Tax=Spirodela intermedia TaxID=51605 RepID=A0A7I8JCS0_SPIIN|nr:unnamed protein product [Spirodela intermedia]CAA6667202.1 unnamed protein product [Spirodela intermedia]